MKQAILMKAWKTKSWYWECQRCASILDNNLTVKSPIRRCQDCGQINYIPRWYVQR